MCVFHNEIKLQNIYMKRKTYKMDENGDAPPTD